MNDVTLGYIRRLRRIREAIDEHFRYICREWEDIPLKDWEITTCPATRYGWDFKIVGTFCTELITNQTSHLDPKDLRNYLRAILWHIDRHIVMAYENPDMPDMERHRRIESELYDEAPQSMALMSAVEMKALDE